MFVPMASLGSAKAADKGKPHFRKELTMSKDMLGIAVRKLVTLPGHVLGLVCDLLEKLSDPEWVEATKRFLRKENPWPAPTPREWKVWRTINLGTGLRTADDFRTDLREAGCRLGDWASDMLNQDAFTAGVKESKVELVVVSVAELGFQEAATREDIYTRAISLGLGLCPAEIGPQLRLQYKGQPEGEWLRVAMEPITGSGGRLNVFSVERDRDELWLDSDGGHPDYVWYPGHRWVFVRRK
jgi:hypothetical protein